MHGNVVDLNLNMWTIIFTLFNALTLFIFLRFLLFKPVMKFIEDRKAAIRNEFETADQVKNEAFSLKEQYEHKLAGINGEKKAIIDEAREMSGFIMEKGKLEAEQEKTRILKNAETEKKLMYEKAKEQLKKETVLLSVGIAEEILKKEIDKNTHELLINKTIDELSEVKV